MIVPRPPSPSKMPAGWTYYSQTDFTRQRGSCGITSLYDTLDTIATHVDNLLHRFGVTTQRGYIYVSRETVRVTLHLAAGDWQGTWTGATKLTGHPSGRLCARILRFLEAHHEELG